MVGYKADGKLDRRYVYAKTQRAVVNKLAALRRRHADGLLGTGTSSTVDAFLTKWVESRTGNRTHAHVGVL